MQVLVGEVTVDSHGRLRVKPLISSDDSYELIYRAACGVAWDWMSRTLFTQVPKEWTLAQWYAQVAEAVWSEYRDWLRISPDTRWVGVTEETRRNIERWDDDFNPSSPA